ncbi:hypothetical protein EVG20_g6383 [Dentipellis fragilis]|uniref:Uncharacterized protein n=1 Tax=Dentipellis fragilis TaxID=205917 RepID=A0A4Y9YMV6_9AGAM|nr:hypothetical protein EVG20_g6383 [Dentipellis fragilis]
MRALPRALLFRATQYNPYFFVILDARTATDGTGIIVYNEMLGDPPWELRTTAATISITIVNLEIYNYTIEEELGNMPDDPDEAATWACDAPLDNSELHHDVRVPLDKFEKLDDAPDGFVKFRIEDVTTLVPEYPSGLVELLWFGEPPEEALLECIEQDRHSTGEGEARARAKVVTFQTGPNALGPI